MASIRAVRYLRVSTEGQQADKKYGYARQRITAVRSEQQHGLEIVAEVTDVISGAISERPGLASLPAVARLHSATAVSLSQVDRLSRDLPGGYAIISELLSTQLDIYASNLSSRVNFRDPQSVREVNDALREAFMERHQIRARTHDGLLAKAADGYTRRPLSLYGYQNGEIDEAKAVWVRHGYELGLTQGTPSIAITLNAQGSRTATGKLWHHRAVNDMLKNPTYKGESGFGRELFCSECRETRQGHQRDVERGYGFCKRCGGRMALTRITVAVPAIVTPERWEAVQQALHTRNVKPGRRGNRLHIYALTGRIVCGVCDSAVSGMTSVDGYHYYRCSASRRTLPGRERCPHRKGYRHDAVHEAVLRELAQLIRYPEVVEAALNAAETDVHAEDRKRAELSRAELSERLERIENGYLAGVLSIEKALTQRREIETKLTGIPSYPLPKKRALHASQFVANLEDALATLPLSQIVSKLGISVVLAPDGLTVCIV